MSQLFDNSLKVVWYITFWGSCFYALSLWAVFTGVHMAWWILLGPFAAILMLFN